MTPLGRRPGSGTAREPILKAARELFAQRGLENTSIRAIAERAEVDPALIYRFFGSKQGLFEAALDETLRPEELFGDLIDGGRPWRGHEFVRRFLALWSRPGVRTAWLGIFRSAVASERGRDVLAHLMQRVVVDRLGGAIAGPDGERRAALISAHLAGVVLTRYVLGLEPMASLSDDELVALIGPVIEHYLRDPLPVEVSESASQLARERP